MLLLQLVKRNILIYIREKSSVFFSLLSAMIIIGLMVIFLGKMNSDEVVSLLQQYGGERDTLTDQSNATQLVFMWSLAGIVVVNSVSITLTMIGEMVTDETSNRLSSFYVSPVNRILFVLGYIVAAIIMGILMCFLTVIIGEFIIYYNGGTFLTLAQTLRILLYIVINVFISSCMIFFIANFVHSNSAFSALATIMGTLVGFLSGIYLPMGMLPEKIQTVLKLIPILHGSSLMRDAFTKEAIETTFRGMPEELVQGYQEFMGISITWQGDVIENNTKIAFLLVSGVLLIVISVMLQKRRNVMRR